VERKSLDSIKQDIIIKWNVKTRGESYNKQKEASEKASTRHSVCAILSLHQGYIPVSHPYGSHPALGSVPQVQPRSKKPRRVSLERRQSPASLPALERAVQLVSQVTRSRAPGVGEPPSRPISVDRVEQPLPSLADDAHVSGDGCRLFCQRRPLPRATDALTSKTKGSSVTSRRSHAFIAASLDL
jgi:hypothetical protein